MYLMELYRIRLDLEEKKLRDENMFRKPIIVSCDMDKLF